MRASPELEAACPTIVARSTPSGPSTTKVIAAVRERSWKWYCSVDQASPLTLTPPCLIVSSCLVVGPEKGENPRPGRTPGVQAPEEAGCRGHGEPPSCSGGL